MRGGANAHCIPVLFTTVMTWTRKHEHNYAGMGFCHTSFFNFKFQLEIEEKGMNERSRRRGREREKNVNKTNRMWARLLLFVNLLAKAWQKCIYRATRECVYVSLLNWLNRSDCVRVCADLVAVEFRLFCFSFPADTPSIDLTYLFDFVSSSQMRAHHLCHLIRSHTSMYARQRTTFWFHLLNTKLLLNSWLQWHCRCRSTWFISFHFNFRYSNVCCDLKSVFTCASTCFMFNVHVSSECARKKNGSAISN